MKYLISCEFNIDTACVEMKFTDGSMIAVDTIAVENEVADNMYQRSELDYLIYNAPLEYADLILNGDPEIYLKTVTEYNLWTANIIVARGRYSCGRRFYLYCKYSMNRLTTWEAVLLLFRAIPISRYAWTFRGFAMILYKKQSLLILDEWLLYHLKETEARDLLEIAEARYKKASTIFCSQFDVPGWREKIGEPILADAICDRIIHDSYSVVIECKEINT